MSCRSCGYGNVGFFVSAPHPVRIETNNIIVIIKMIFHGCPSIFIILRYWFYYIHFIHLMQVKICIFLIKPSGLMVLAIFQRYLIISTFPIYGLKASGTITEPSSCWKFSIGCKVLPTARPELFKV